MLAENGAAMEYNEIFENRGFLASIVPAGSASTLRVHDSQSDLGNHVENLFGYKS